MGILTSSIKLWLYVSSNTRTNGVSSLPTLEVPYKIPLNLSKGKRKDLISLINLGIIPSQHMDFLDLYHGTTMKIMIWLVAIVKNNIRSYWILLI